MAEINFLSRQRAHQARKAAELLPFTVKFIQFDD
jgi:hypothetical protein